MRTSIRSTLSVVVVALLAFLAWVLFGWGRITVAPEPVNSSTAATQPHHTSNSSSDPTHLDDRRARSAVLAENRVSLRVVDANTGVPLSHVPLTLRASTRIAEPPDSTHKLESRLVEVVSGMTDNEGWWEIVVPTPGFYAVSIDDDFVYIVDGAKVNINNTRDRLHHVSATVGGRVVGYMLDQHGRGVCNGFVYANVGLLKSLSGQRVKGRPSPFSSAGERVIRTNVEGRYVVRGVPQHAKLRIVGVHPVLCGARMTVQGGELRETVFAPPLQMTVGSKFAVRLLDKETGDAIAGARVVFQPARESVSLPKELRSDNFGIVEFASIPDGQHHVVVLASDYAVRRAPISVPTPERDVTIQMSRSGELSGRIIDRHTRNPIAGARVDAKIQFGRASLSLSRLCDEKFEVDSSGSFSIPYIPEGSIRLYCYSAGYISQPKRMVSSPLENILIEMDPHHIIKGKLLGREGAPVEHFMVSWKRLDNDGGWQGPQKISDSLGRFAIEGLEEGEWLVRAFTDTGYALSPSIKLSVSTGPPIASGLELTLKSKISISGFTVDIATGEPVSGARVRIGPRRGRRSPLADIVLGHLFEQPLPMAAARTNLVGGFSLQVGDDQPMRVLVQADGYEPYSANLESVDLARIPLAVLESFDGLVRLANGAPAVQGRAFALSKDSPFPISMAKIDPAGKFELSLNSQVQMIRISSSSKFGASKTWIVERELSEIDRRKTTVFTVSNEDCELHGSINSGGVPLEDFMLRLTMVVDNVNAWNPTAPTAIVKTDARGRFELKGIAAGQYAWRLDTKKLCEGTLTVLAGASKSLDIDISQFR